METGHPSTRAVNSGSGNRALVVANIDISVTYTARCSPTFQLRPDQTHGDHWTRTTNHQSHTHQYCHYGNIALQSAQLTGGVHLVISANAYLAIQ